MDIMNLFASLKWINPILWPNCGKAEPPDEFKRDGFLAYADGVNWNPGSGKGVYRWDTASESWQFISGGGGGGGDMLKAVYDTNDNSVVDNSEKIDGRTIYVSGSPPTPDDGENGDIWIEY